MKTSPEIPCGGFSEGGLNVFHISMTQFSLPSDQAVCGQGYIAHGHDQPPCQDGAADHTAQNEVEGKQGDPSTQGAAARYDPEAHPMEAEGQDAEYPEPYIVQLAALHAGGFENAV